MSPQITYRFCFRLTGVAVINWPVKEIYKNGMAMLNNLFRSILFSKQNHELSHTSLWCNVMLPNYYNNFYGMNNVLKFVYLLCMSTSKRCIFSEIIVKSLVHLRHTYIIIRNKGDKTPIPQILSHFMCIGCTATDVAILQRCRDEHTGVLRTK